MGREGIAIRRARDGDEALLLELNREVQSLHAAGEPKLFKSVVSDLAPFAAQVADAETHVLIAEVRGAPAGYGVMKVLQRPDGPFGHAATFVYVDQMAVLSAFQRHGVGTALIEQAKALAAEAGTDQVILEVWNFNAGARDFYAAQGFTPMKHRLRLEV
ncbi:MAG: GNAT family N-acetyltransferase [Thermomicrobiales bacterium]